ncbi:hypothetical protein HQ560_06380, partial [bacterium]|nr:hypothetical protein [bacterium]
MPRKSLLLLAIVIAMFAAPPAMAEEGPDGKALAWVRFENGPESYSRRPYLWLGRQQIDLTVDVKPAKGQVIDLLWGSKGGARSAVLVVNGKPQTVKGGGYDGFRWKRVNVPAGVQGDAYQISIRQGGGKAAFLAEVRLTDPAGKGGDPDPAKAAAHRATVKTVAAIAPPAPVAPPLPTDPLERSAEIAGFTISKVQRWLHE